RTRRTCSSNSRSSLRHSTAVDPHDHDHLMAMTSEDTVRAYLRAIETMDVDAGDRFFHPEIVVTEHPNKLNPAGKTYDRAALREAGERGKTLLASQRYEIRGLIANGDRVCAQTEWIGVTKTG